MHGSVKGIGLMVLALGFAGCAGHGSSGTVSPERSFVGVWEGIPGVDPQSPKDTTGKTPLTHALLIGADSIYAEVTVRGRQAGCGGGRWALHGSDSVSWMQSGNAPMVKDKIVFKDQQFFLYRGGNLTKPAEAYRRADTTVTPKPKHLAGLPQCASTIRRALRTPPKPASK